MRDADPLPAQRAAARHSAHPDAPARSPKHAIAVRVTSDGARPPIAAARVQAIAERVLRAERCRGALIDITFVAERTIARLNRQHFGHESSTDIITLEHAPFGAAAPAVGDVFIAPAVARRNARALRTSSREETARLTIHGVLHALGWEHPEGVGREASAMWKRQERLLRLVVREQLV